MRLTKTEAHLLRQAYQHGLLGKGKWTVTSGSRKSRKGFRRYPTGSIREFRAAQSLEQKGLVKITTKSLNEPWDDADATGAESLIRFELTPAGVAAAKGLRETTMQGLTETLCERLGEARSPLTQTEWELLQQAQQERYASVELMAIVATRQSRTRYQGDRRVWQAAERLVQRGLAKVRHKERTPTDRGGWHAELQIELTDKGRALLKSKEVEGG